MFTTASTTHDPTRPAAPAGAAALQLLLQTHPRPVWIYDRAERTILAVNDAALAEYGYDREQFLALSVEEFCPAEDGQVRAGPRSGRRRLRLADGRFVDVASLAHPLTYQDRGAVLVMAQADPQEKDPAELIRRSEARFRRMVEQSWDIIALVDEKGRISYVSDSVRHVLGYEAAEQIGQDATTLVHPDDLALAQATLVAVTAVPNTPHTIQLRCRHKAGGWIRLEVIASNLLADPDIGAIVVNSRDITARVTADEQRRYQAFLLENVSDAIIATDLGYNVTSWNKAAEELYGRTVVETMGRPLAQVMPTRFIHDQPDEVLSQFLVQGSWQGEVFHQAADGAEHRILSSVTLLKDEAGQPIGAVTVNRNITAQVQFERRLRKLNRLYAVMSSVNQLIVRTRDLAILFDEACRIAVQQGGFQWAWIALLDPQTGRLTVAAEAGGDADRGPGTMAAGEQCGAGPVGRAIQTGRYVIANDIASDPALVPWREDALAAGYRSLAVFPLTVLDSIRGVLCLYAGEPNFFDQEEIRLLDELTLDIAFAMEFLEREEQRQLALVTLRSRDAILEGVAYAASRLLPAEDWEEVTDDVLERLGAATGVDRIYIFQNHADEAGTLYTSQRFEWVAGGIEPQVDNPDLQDVPMLAAGFGRWCERLSAGESIYGHIHEFPDSERELLAAQGILSLLVVPVFVDRKWWGFMGFDSCRSERTWTMPAQDALRAAANLLGAAIQRRRVRRQLAEKSEELERFFTLALDLLCIADTEGHFLRVNKAWESILGYNVDQLEGRGFLDFVHPDDKQATMAALASPASQAPVLNFINRYQNYHGDYRFVEWRARPYGNRIYAAARDITERRRAEEALRRSEQLYQSLVDALPQSLYRIDLAGRLTFLNQKLLDDLGLTLDDCLGWTADDFYGPELAEKYRADDRQVVETGEPLLTIERNVQRRTGQESFVEVIKIPVRDHDGQIVGIQGMFWDITERMLAEQERSRRVRQLQQILDSIPEGVLLLDGRGQVTLANPLGEQNLMALAGAAAGDTIGQLGGRPLAMLLAAQQHDQVHEFAAQGRQFELIARAMGAEDLDDAWVVVLRDVTEERALQRYHEVQDRLATVGQMAAGIAHDFNNVMAAIVLYAQMLLRSPDLSPRNRDYLARIDERAQHASELIGQILDFSRRSIMERQPIDLLGLSRELLRLLEHTLPETISLRLHHDQNEYLVYADPTRLKQVLMNLALNARDAMPEGGELAVTLRQLNVGPGDIPPLPDVEPGDWVAIAVTDSGTGIAAENLPHLFEPFFTTKEPGKGTGLGLAQVYGIVKQHNGAIDVRSRPGEGASFVVYLPLLSMAAVETAPAAGSTAVPGGSETILLVEDNQATRIAVAEVLTGLGYRVIAAATGREGLAIFEQQQAHIDLVISDMVMPEVSGRQLFHALRAHDPAVSVIVMTGYPLGEDQEELRQAGIADWVGKPFEIADLANRLRAVLDRRD